MVIGNVLFRKNRSSFNTAIALTMRSPASSKEYKVKAIPEPVSSNWISF